MTGLSLGLAADDSFALALEACRAYLLSVANAEMPGRLTPKGGASDLVQDTLTQAYLVRDRFHGQSLADLRSWLRGILANEMAMFRRRYRAGCRDAAREVPVGSDGCGHPPGPADPVDHMIRTERIAAVDASLARLPDTDREVLVLRLEQQLGFREIGARIGRTEDAARKLFVRALDRLRGTVPDPPE
jgi:RNA polymerase sigma-70 factor (ECF subfamily)